VVKDWSDQHLIGLRISQDRLNHLGIFYWIAWSYDLFPLFYKNKHVQANWHFFWYFNRCFLDITSRALELSFFIIQFSKSYKFFWSFPSFRVVLFLSWLQPRLLVLLCSKLFFEDAILLRMSMVLWTCPIWLRFLFLSFRPSELCKTSCALRRKHII